MLNEGLADVVDDDGHKQAFDNVLKSDSKKEDHIVQVVLQPGAKDAQCNLIVSTLRTQEVMRICTYRKKDCRRKKQWVQPELWPPDAAVAPATPKWKTIVEDHTVDLRNRNTNPLTERHIGVSKRTETVAADYCWLLQKHTCLKLTLSFRLEAASV